MTREGDQATPHGTIVVCVAISDLALAKRMASLLSSDGRFDVYLSLDDNRDADVILADRIEASLRPSIIIYDSDHGPDAWDADVRAVLPPTIDADLLRAAIVMVAAGFAISGPDTLRGFSEETSRSAHSSTIGDGEMSLTPRESEVLGLLARGASNKVIARELKISVHTAKFHVASLLAKLGARNRSDAVAIGIQRSLVLL